MNPGTIGEEAGWTPKPATGRWSMFLSEVLHDLYSSQNFVRMIKLRKMGWADHVARIGMRGAYVLVIQPERKKQLGRRRYRWCVNIMCLMA
jgi:hypothetical protein